MTRVLAALAVVSVVAGGCASQPAASRAATPASPPAPAPFSDRELADELVRQGVGVPKDAPTTPPGPGEDVPTEIRRTPRGVVVTFRYVLFAFDSAELTPQARKEIERMALVLNHPQAAARRITLEGHTDAIGTEAYNRELSRRRAEVVAQELVAGGLQRDRVNAEGFGKQRPVAPNTLADGKDNPAGRALNRRVEAVVQATGGAPR
jgi:outer membrane protein OmpA-like peptidoglycan-associated protein